MNKDSQKPKRRRAASIPIPVKDALVAEFGVSVRYINEAINYARQGGLCDRIRSKHTELMNKVNNAIKS